MVVLELGSGERKLIYIGTPDFSLSYKCAILEGDSHRNHFVGIGASVWNPDFLRLKFRGLADFGHEGLCSGQAPMGKLNFHGYIKLCKNGGIMKLPSPVLMPSKWVCLGTNLYGEVISGCHADPFIGHGAAGLETCLSRLALLRLFWQQHWCDTKGLLHMSAPAAPNAMRIISFLPLRSRPSMPLVHPEVPSRLFPAVSLQVLSETEKEGKQFFVLQKWQRKHFHMCPGAQIVKTDLVLSPSHRCGWFFSGEVRWGELNKLIWVFFSSSISCQDFLRKKY